MPDIELYSITHFFCQRPEKKKFFEQPYHNILSIWLVILLCVEGSSNSVLYSCPKSGTHSHLQCAPPSLLQCWPQVLLPSSFSSTCRHHCQAYNSNQYHSLFQKRVHWIECSWLPAGESSKMKKKSNRQTKLKDIKLNVFFVISFAPTTNGRPWLMMRLCLKSRKVMTPCV